MRLLIFLLLVTTAFTLQSLRHVKAHEIRPAVVTASVAENGTLDLEVKANLEALIAGISQQHTDTDDDPNASRYNALRALSSDLLEQRFRQFSQLWLDGIDVRIDDRPGTLSVTRVLIPDVGNLERARISTVILSAKLPSGAQTFTWRYSSAFGSSVLRMQASGGKVAAVGWLQNGALSPPVSLSGVAEASTVAVFVDYLWLGFTHILPKGLDHILFVLGLYLLNSGIRPLIAQVTAFTLAHSVTLALGLYGVVEISPAIVEPLIAASIAYVAIENMFTSKLTLWRPAVVFAFGLLHGLGFAGVLQELGLPDDAYVLGLVAFNVGVEGGQLAVIAIAWLSTTLLLLGRSQYRSAVSWYGSLCIACFGIYWTIERIMWV